MNEELYRNLLKYAKFLLSKQGKLITEPGDIVHSVWDFKNENEGEIKRLMNRYYYDELDKKQIPFTRFQTKSTDTDFIGKRIKNDTESEKQCASCLKILHITKFSKDTKRPQNRQKRCISCIYKNNREHILELQKIRYKKNPEKFWKPSKEKEKEKNKEYREKHRAELLAKAKLKRDRLTDSYIRQNLRKMNKGIEITQEMIVEKRNKIIQTRNKRKQS